MYIHFGAYFFIKEQLAPVAAATSTQAFSPVSRSNPIGPFGPCLFTLLRKREIENNSSKKPTALSSPLLPSFYPHGVLLLFCPLSLSSLFIHAIQNR